MTMDQETLSGPAPEVFPVHVTVPLIGASPMGIAAGQYGSHCEPLAPDVAGSAGGRAPLGVDHCNGCPGDTARRLWTTTGAVRRDGATSDRSRLTILAGSEEGREAVPIPAGRSSRSTRPPRARKP